MHILNIKKKINGLTSNIFELILTQRKNRYSTEGYYEEHEEALYQQAN